MEASDGSEGADSAPSEFLAEFLSAIMRRQHAEALKYCRLILQYEPHNATARGFYPLLQHKLRHCHGGSHSSSSGAGAGRGAGARLQAAAADSEDDSVGSQSSLELDSEPSLELRTDSEPAPARPRRAGAPPAPAGWESSDTDDNGNAPPAPPHSLSPRPLHEDLENDNAGDAASGEPHRTTHPKDAADSTAALRRLRAQFTCSIK